MPLLQLGLPLEPRRFLVLNLQGLEERVVVKPGCLLFAEIPESVAFSLFLEVLPRTLQMLLLERPRPLIIDESGRTVGRRLHVTRREQSVVDEHVERNEHGIARERRRRLIRRIAEIADGAQRQNLPDLLPGSGEEIDEAISVAAKIADAVLRRQGRRMKQDARFAREAPFLLHGLVDASRKGRDLHGQDAALNLHTFLPFKSFLQCSLQKIADIEHDLLFLRTTAVDDDNEGFVLCWCTELVRAASDRARIGENVALTRERQEVARLKRRMLVSQADELPVPVAHGDVRILPCVRTTVVRVAKSLHADLIAVVDARHSRIRHLQERREAQPIRAELVVLGVEFEARLMDRRHAVVERRLTQERDRSLDIVAADEVHHYIKVFLRVVLSEALQKAHRLASINVVEQEVQNRLAERIVHRRVDLLPAKILARHAVTDLVRRVLPDLADEDRVRIRRLEFAVESLRELRGQFVDDI